MPEIFLSESIFLSEQAEMSCPNEDRMTGADMPHVKYI